MADRTSWAARAGDEIVPGRTVVRRLGGGKRAEVYIAADERLRTPVIVKILRPGEEERGLAGLRSEAEALGALAHPQFPRLLDTGLDDGRPHIVMELIEGPRLSRLVRKFGPLALEQLVPLAVELASALHYLHGAGWVHLDVKPGNVVMSGQPRLIDLSIARTIESAGRLTKPIGTTSYMAPEQCQPAPGLVGPPADVYGMGATLYHAATGERPFPKDADGPTYPQVTGDPERLSRKRFPAALADAIESLLAREPGERPSAGEFADELEGLVAALPRRPVLGRLRPKFRSR